MLFPRKLRGPIDARDTRKEVLEKWALMNESPSGDYRPGDPTARSWPHRRSIVPGRQPGRPISRQRPQQRGDGTDMATPVRETRRHPQRPHRRNLVTSLQPGRCTTRRPPSRQNDTIVAVDLESLARKPLGKVSLTEVERLRQSYGELSAVERAWIELITALVHWRHRHDVELVEVPRAGEAGNSDIELGG